MSQLPPCLKSAQALRQHLPQNDYGHTTRDLHTHEEDLKKLADPSRHSATAAMWRKLLEDARRIVQRIDTQDAHVHAHARYAVQAHMKCLRQCLEHAEQQQS